MLTPKTLKTLVETLDRLEREYLESYYRMNTSKQNVYGRYPAARVTDIKAAERKSGTEFPPSYRLFLRLQNGWRRFGLGWSLLGTPCQATRDIRADVEHTLKQLPTVATDEEAKSISRDSKRDPRVILPTEHLVFGTDFNGGLLVFDGNRRSKAGEAQVVSVRYGTHVENRWKDFEHFLRHVIATVEKRVAKMRPSDGPSKQKQTSRRAPASTTRAGLKHPKRGRSPRKRR